MRARETREDNGMGVTRFINSDRAGDGPVRRTPGFINSLKCACDPRFAVYDYRVEVVAHIVAY